MKRLAAFWLLCASVSPARSELNESALNCLFDGGCENAAQAATVPAPALSVLPRRHSHYSLGRHEDDKDNAVSKASLIRGAGVAGHLINALPPAALAGSAKMWWESVTGDYGKGPQQASLWASLILPVALVGMTIYVMVDNMIDAVSDAVSPQPRWGITGDGT